MAFRNSKKFDSIIEGYMEKLSTKKKWQKRYFVLNEHCLLYYPDKKKSPSKVKEVMALENVSKVEMVEVGTTRSKTFEVQITCGSNFPYPLKTACKQEADQWLDALLDTLQEGKAQRSSQGSMKTQQDMMMQVAMAMNMGLQMGMQNNNDQLATLATIHQSTMNNRLSSELGRMSGPAMHNEPVEVGGGVMDPMVTDAMGEVDAAISAGEAKTSKAVQDALDEAKMLAECAEEDDEDTVQPTPAELANDAGVNLTASFANFYNDAFGDDVLGDDTEVDEDPFGEAEPTTKKGAISTQAEHATVNP